MNLYDGYSSKNIAWTYGYYMALYDDNVKQWTYIIVIAVRILREIMVITWPYMMTVYI